MQPEDLEDLDDAEIAKLFAKARAKWRLSDMSINSVDLVDRAANNHVFLVRKRVENAAIFKALYNDALTKNDLADAGHECAIWADALRGAR